MTDLNAPVSYAELVEDAVIQVGGCLLSPVEADLAIRWELEGVPLNVVRAAIQQKAERMKPAQRLRLLWVQDDLAEVYENWRRSVGA